MFYVLSLRLGICAVSGTVLLHRRSRVSSLWLLLAHNKWYQSFPGSSWDFLAIRRASGADSVKIVCRSQISDVLFVGSCVDLRTTQGVLKESLVE